MQTASVFFHRNDGPSFGWTIERVRQARWERDVLMHSEAALVNDYTADSEKFLSNPIHIVSKLKSARIRDDLIWLSATENYSSTHLQHCIAFLPKTMNHRGHQAQHAARPLELTQRGPVARDIWLSAIGYLPRQVRQFSPVTAGIDPDCAIATECDDLSCP